jgi:hypothetical protein
MRIPSAAIPFAIATALCTASPAAAQTPAPNPNQSLVDEKDRLAAEKEVLAAQTEKLKAEIALLQARIPVLPVGKDGTISIGSGSAYAIGAVRKVYESLDRAALTVCTEVKKFDTAAPGRIVLLGSESGLDSVRFTLVDKELGLIEDELDRLLPAPLAPAAVGVAAIGPILSAVVSVTKLFRTDKTLRAETVAVDSGYLEDRVFQCLKTGGLKGALLYPSVTAEQILLAPENSKFVGRLSRLTSRRGGISNAIAAKHANAKADSVNVSVEIAQQGGMSMVTSSIWRSDRLFVGGGVIATYRVTRGRELLSSGVAAEVEPRLQQVNLDTH